MAKSANNYLQVKLLCICSPLTPFSGIRPLQFWVCLFISQKRVALPQRSSGQHTFPTVGICHLKHQDSEHKIGKISTRTSTSSACNTHLHSFMKKSQLLVETLEFLERDKREIKCASGVTTANDTSLAAWVV